jgi:hypothetical protein
MTAVGRISVNRVDDIEEFPVNFLVDGGTVVLRTAPGTELAMIGDVAGGPSRSPKIVSWEQIRNSTGPSTRFRSQRPR